MNTVEQTYVDLGILEPTKIYAIQLIEIARIDGGSTLEEIIEALKAINKTNLLVNPAHPNAIDHMKMDGLTVQPVRLRSTPND